MFSLGMTDFACPVRIPEKNGDLQATVARIDLIARAPAPRASAEALRALVFAHLEELDRGFFTALLAEARAGSGAERVRLTMRFPYFIEKTAPVSGTTSLMEYRCAFQAESPGEDEEPGLTVVVPVTTLCPCSRAISEAGAHNQRATVTLAVRPRKLIWLEDLISLAESCGSGEVYALLKRPDEKFVTEWAYNHPMFVEDVARMVAQKAALHPDIARFSVAVESFESIHCHNAFALVDSESMGAGAIAGQDPAGRCAAAGAGQGAETR